MKSEILGIIRESKDSVIVNLRLSVKEAERLSELGSDPVRVKITKWRESRSLDANAYYWSLNNQVAKELGCGEIEVYQKHIRELGIYKSILISKEAVATFIHIWQTRGKGWIVDKIDEEGEMVRLHAYYGSSSFNSKQMYLLIQSIEVDCKGLGIPTLDELKAKAIVDKWEAKL